MITTIVYTSIVVFILTAFIMFYIHKKVVKRMKNKLLAETDKILDSCLVCFGNYVEEDTVGYDDTGAEYTTKVRVKKITDAGFVAAVDKYKTTIQKM